MSPFDMWRAMIRRELGTRRIMVKYRVYRWW